MPQVSPVTAATMNYAGPILVVVIGLSWLWYKVYWVSRYNTTVLLDGKFCLQNPYLQHQHYHGPGGRLLEAEPRDALHYT